MSFEIPEEKQKTDKEDVVFVSPEKRKVTVRDYVDYLGYFVLSEKDLMGKKILDIGSGMSDFSKIANKKFQKKGTTVVAMDPIYAFFGGDTHEFIKNLSEANMTSHFGRDKWEREFAYRETKSTPKKIAGSHQNLPFKNESLDLVLANNSATQYKDREITKHALSEIGKALKKDGEARIFPADLMFDKNIGSLYVHTFEAPTQKTREEAKKLGLLIAPDRGIFNIFKELESKGFTFYAIPRHSRRRSPFRMPPNYCIIMRKDDKIPDTEATSSLVKLSFKDSPDGYHVSSQAVSLEKK